MIWAVAAVLAIVAGLVVVLGTQMLRVPEEQRTSGAPTTEPTILADVLCVRLRDLPLHQGRAWSARAVRDRLEPRHAWVVIVEDDKQDCESLLVELSGKQGRAERTEWGVQVHASELRRGRGLHMWAPVRLGNGPEPWPELASELRER